MTDDFELTRRKALAALGTVGVASAGAGLGTSAYFSDQETFENNSLTAGTLDMKVAATEYYSDWSADEAQHAGMASDEESADILLPPGPAQTDARPIAIDVDDDEYLSFSAAIASDENGTPYNRINGGVFAAADSLCGTGSDADGPAVIEIADVKPGDFGGTQFAFELCDNPGYVWLTGGLDAASEGVTTEPERDDPDEESGTVELLDEIQVGYGVLSLDGDSPDAGGANPVFYSSEQYTLREFLARLDGDGIALDGNINAEIGGGTGDQGCFSGGNPDDPSVHLVSIAWWLPIDHGNQVQSDSVQFDLGFYTEQCRHNAGETDLVAYYPFEGSAADLSGNGYDGTLNGDVSFASGQIGRAASFDGDDDYVQTPYSPSLSDPLTLSAWVSVPTALSGRRQIVSPDDAGYDWSILYDEFDQWALFTGEGVLRGPSITTGQPTLVTGVWDPEASETRLYVNGSLVATGPLATGTTTNAFRIGDNPDFDENFNGWIDDVRIYTRALSASEVQALYDSA
ncbi:LamG domain-containing protein [Haloplanus natans]|uniref:LamG domain-containing protein n=1 Tax=Haloplanus natans TaxID=376171 RepID=UPI0006783207|nr:LamG domain-containing protein [Haloplanus natans]